jgi:hypothetical protein
MEELQQHIETISPEKRKRDTHTLIEMINQITGQQPALWPGKIIGWGIYEYTYKTGHSGKCARIGFAARKGALTLYLMGDLQRFQPLLEQLGEHSTGVGCVYIKDLEKADKSALIQIFTELWNTR